MSNKLIVWFDKIGLSDVSLVGGKNGSLGEMICNLKKIGIRVPYGFAVTTNAYQYFLEYNNLVESIQNDLNEIDYNDHVILCRIAQKIRISIKNGEFPKDLENEILDKYQELCLMYKPDADKNYEVDVAIRSSATCEDLANCSFAGAHDTYLAVKSGKNVLEKIKNCFASLYTERAIDYRKNINYGNNTIKISVGVQKMVRADCGGCAGVAFSCDNLYGNDNVITIHSNYGLGESVVGGTVEVDEIIIHKENLRRGYLAIVDKRLGSKKEQMIYSDSLEKRTQMIEVHEEARYKFCMSEEHALELAKWVLILEEYYSKRNGSHINIDCEFGVDGQTGQLFLLQCRPETVHTNINSNILVEYKFTEEPPEPIAKGIAVCEKIVSGKVKVIFTMDTRVDKIEFEEGDILVTTFSTPDMEPLMKKCSAVITCTGGTSSHCSIVCRELNKPAVLSVTDATKIFKNGDILTVSCAQGSTGYIYKGIIPFEKEETVLNFSEPPCKIVLNVADPSQAYSFARLPNSGVGLLRLEHLISNHIGIHPMALINPDKVDSLTLNKIKELTKGYNDLKKYYVDNLVFGISKIASAFPIDTSEIIVRGSDFKSNEFRGLIGGNFFEPHEEAPIIGWRGACKYYSNEFRPAFELECKAMSIVRDIIGFKNVHFEFPFVRTTDELIKIQEICKENGMERGNDGLKHCLMCEVTSNVILADDFSPLVDYVSIGSNDLQMASIMCSRDDTLVQHLNNEDKCLKKMISMAIKCYHSHGLKISICGDRPSIDFEFFKFLVDEGIDAISLSPNCVLKTLKMWEDYKKKLFF